MIQGNFWVGDGTRLPNQKQKCKQAFAHLPEIHIEGMMTDLKWDRNHYWDQTHNQGLKAILFWDRTKIAATPRLGQTDLGSNQIAVKPDTSPSNRWACVG